MRWLDKKTRLGGEHLVGLYGVSCGRKFLSLDKVVVDQRVGCGCFVNPTFVKIFGKLTIGNNKLEFHKSGDVVVDAHNHGVSAVRIFGIIAKIGLTFFEAHAVFATVLHNFVADGGGNLREEKRETAYAVLRDVEHIALWHAVDEIGVQKLDEILLALHIAEPVVVGRAYIQNGGFCKRNCHFVEHEKNDKFLHLAIQRLI